MTPESIPDYLRWLDDMARRFNISTNIGRLLKDKMDIDLIVGDPWTLRPDTLVAMKRIPDRIRLRLFNFMSTNAAHIFSQLDLANGNFPASTAALTSSSSTSDQSINIIIPSDLTSSLNKTISDSFFSGALNDAQMIDLAVFILSKAPFFPKTKEGWDQFKGKLVEFDIYLALIVVVIMIFFNQGAFGFSGYLFEGPLGMRIGWYTSMKKLGFSLQPEIKGGLVLKHQYFDTRVGVIKNFGDQDRTRVEAELVSLLFSTLAQKVGWEGKSSFRYEYTMNAKDQNLENKGNVTVNFYLRKGEIFYQHSPLAISVLASGGSAMDGKPLGTGSFSIENDHDGYQLVLTGGYAPPTFPTFPIVGQNIWTAGLFATWQSAGGYRQVAALLETAGVYVLSDLDKIDSLKEKIKTLLNQGHLVGDDKIKQEQFWLGMARVQLKRHLSAYRDLMGRYSSIRAEGDLDRSPLLKTEMIIADAEAHAETFGAEKSPLNIW